MGQNGQKNTWGSIPTLNKDIILLSRVLYTMQAVSATEQKRMWAQDRLWHMTQKITGLPGGGGVPSGYDADFAVIGEIEEKYGSELSECDQELQEAERILDSIKSQTMRTFVTMKYVLHMPDRTIMRELNIRRWRFENMRRAIEEAPDMASVKWIERYTLIQNSKNSK